MTDQLLMIFAKNPVAGKVKTRLAKTIGNERALEIYIQLLEHTRSITRNLNCDKAIFYSDYIEDLDIWHTAGYQQFLQKGENLGDKMQNAFHEAFRKGYKKVAIIGSDCGELSTTVIQQAFDVLLLNDVVVGPTYDGGYYLLGMKSMHQELFQNKTWSTSDVTSETLLDINRLNLSYKLLTKLSDIDDENDLRKFETDRQNKLKK